MTGGIVFDSNSLQTYNPMAGVGIIANVIDHTDGPEAIFQLMEIANANKSSMGDVNSPSKTIPVGGVIKGSSTVDLDQRIDTFKGYLTGKEKNLDINYAGSTRRYIATAPSNGIKIKREGALNYASFTVQFVCSEPFGKDVTATTIINHLNSTTATYTATPTIGGNAEYQLPIFRITLDALTGAGDYIQISNDSNGQAIMIIGQGLHAGDVVVIDCEMRRVTINDSLVDYIGTFLELDPGNSSITYSDGFTTRTVDIVGTINNRYM